MSVYGKTGTAYLTRTKDLTLSCESRANRVRIACESHANRRGDEVVSPRQQPGDVCLRSKQRFTWARKVWLALLVESTPGTAFYGILLEDAESN
jgi:hypothetical protein